MCIEIVQHQPYLVCLWVLEHKFLAKQRELALCPSRIDSAESHAGLGLDRTQQRARTVFFVLVVLFGNFAFAHRSRHKFVANQETGSFVETDDGIAHIVGLGIQVKNMFEPCKEQRINLANTPALFAMRL